MDISFFSTLLCRPWLRGRVIVLLVPYTADKIIQILVHCDEWFGWQFTAQGTFFAWIEKMLTIGEIAEKIVSVLLFFLFIPIPVNQPTKRVLINHDRRKGIPVIIRSSFCFSILAFGTSCSFTILILYFATN
jgi:hypothetical protein